MTTIAPPSAPSEAPHPRIRVAEAPESALPTADIMATIDRAKRLETVLHKDEARLNRQLDRFERHLPRRAGRSIRWLREPSARWVRIPVGLLLIAGGVFSILPLLGVWMLPLGLLLLAQDLPFLRRPMRRALLWVERRWVRWKRSRRRRTG